MSYWPQALMQKTLACASVQEEQSVAVPFSCMEHFSDG